MTINVYQIGDPVRCSAAFRDLAETAIDPGVVAFTVITPAGVETTYTYGSDAEVVKDATGQYHIDVTASARGVWRYRWASTGAGQSAQQHEFTVEPN